jgi:hypothetical protein
LVKSRKGVWLLKSRAFLVLFLVEWVLLCVKKAPCAARHYAGLVVEFPVRAVGEVQGVSACIPRGTLLFRQICSECGVMQSFRQ